METFLIEDYSHFLFWLAIGFIAGVGMVFRIIQVIDRLKTPNTRGNYQNSDEYRRREYRRAYREEAEGSISPVAAFFIVLIFLLIFLVLAYYVRAHG